MKNRDIIDFLVESDEGFRSEGNIFYAEKAFMVKSVIDYCFARRKEGDLTDQEANRIMKLVYKYLRGEVIMFWMEEGVVGITPIKKGKKDE